MSIIAGKAQEYPNGLNRKRKVIVMYLDLSEWSIKDLMELFYTAQELQCGKLIREVKEEFNRRQKFA